jgi:hypothetical protein
VCCVCVYVSDRQREKHVRLMHHEGKEQKHFITQATEPKLDLSLTSTLVGGVGSRGPVVVRPSVSLIWGVPIGPHFEL